MDKMDKVDKVDQGGKSNNVPEKPPRGDKSNSDTQASAPNPGSILSNPNVENVADKSKEVTTI